VNTGGERRIIGPVPSEASSKDRMSRRVIGVKRRQAREHAGGSCGWRGVVDLRHPSSLDRYATHLGCAPQPAARVRRTSPHRRRR
jgi:hypothetical protein